MKAMTVHDVRLGSHPCPEAPASKILPFISMMAHVVPAT